MLYKPTLKNGKD